jgi:hypothetical protein
MQPTNLGDRYSEHIKSPYDLSRYQTQPRVEVDQHAAKRVSRLITAAGRQARPFLNVYTHRLCVCLSRASGQGCLPLTAAHSRPSVVSGAKFILY